METKGNFTSKELYHEDSVIGNMILSFMLTFLFFFIFFDTSKKMLFKDYSVFQNAILVILIFTGTAAIFYAILTFILNIIFYVADYNENLEKKIKEIASKEIVKTVLSKSEEAAAKKITNIKEDQ